MSANTVTYRQRGVANTTRYPSPDIWGDCPWNDMEEACQEAGHPLGYFGTRFWDDFNDFPLIGTQTTQIAHGRYKVFNTGAGTVRGVSTVNSVEMAGGYVASNLDTDNDSFTLAHSYPSFLLSGLTTNSGKLWFECRLAFTPAATNGLGWFVGLAEVEQWTAATGVPFNGSDAITNSASAIGFRKPEDDTTTADTVYSDRATSFTAIGDADITGLAAYTFVKLGFVYDPERSADCIRFYKDNQQLTNVVSRTTLTGLTNLDANALGFIWSGVADTAGTSSEMYLDWVRIAQAAPQV